MSSKLYMGNLPTDVTEADLRQLFVDLDLSCTDVLVKRGGYGFVDCLDQQAADRFIDKVNGYNYLGTPLVVEPSVSSAASSRRGLMQPLNDHQHYGGGSYQHHPSPYQPRDHQSSMSSGPAGRMSALGAGRTSVGARPGVMSHQQQQHHGYSTAPGLMSPPQSASADFPLRILVNSEMVGAIIGRQGNTIRQITQSTRARVDVHRKDNAGSLEKAITIYGNPDNCDNACKKILEVMVQEADSTNKGEVPLKLLAHNNLIGRIIGKGGNVIKRVMEETDTKITVSSVSDVNGFNQERTITIRGEVDGVSEAERRVVAKLRQSYENDLQVLAPQSVMYPGLHPMAMMSTVGLGYGRGGGGGGPPGAMGGGGLYGSGGGGPTTYPPVYPNPSPPGGHAAGAGTAAETTYLYVPSASVGALIGRKGSYIRNIIRFSGASVKIGQQEETVGGGVERRASDGDADPGSVSPSEEQPESTSEPVPSSEPESTARDNEDASTPPPPALMNHRVADPYSKPPLKSSPPPPAVAERRVTILGSAESQWKAQFLIFDKLREEGYGAGIEDVRLPIEILVPSGQVGRIIGKKGQNVRELQRTSGTLIKLPQPPAAGATPPQFTPVHMVGTFYAVQSAQRRVRSLVAQGAPQPLQSTAARQAAPAADQPEEEEEQTQEDKEQEEGVDKEEEDPSPEVAAAGDTV